MSQAPPIMPAGLAADLHLLVQALHHLRDGAGGLAAAGPYLRGVSDANRHRVEAAIRGSTAEEKTREVETALIDAVLALSRELDEALNPYEALS